MPWVSATPGVVVGLEIGRVKIFGRGHERPAVFKVPGINAVAVDDEVHAAIVVEVFGRHVFRVRRTAVAAVANGPEVDRRREAAALTRVKQQVLPRVFAITDDQVEVVIAVEVANCRSSRVIPQVVDIRQGLERAVTTAPGGEEPAVVANGCNVYLGTNRHRKRLGARATHAVGGKHGDGVLQIAANRCGPGNQSRQRVDRHACRRCCQRKVDGVPKRDFCVSDFHLVGVRHTFACRDDRRRGDCRWRVNRADGNREGGGVDVAVPVGDRETTLVKAVFGVLVHVHQRPGSAPPVAKRPGIVHNPHVVD